MLNLIFISVHSIITFTMNLCSIKPKEGLLNSFLWNGFSILKRNSIDVIAITLNMCDPGTYPLVCVLFCQCYLNNK